ncbi:MAG: PAS domain-containing protein [Bacteroidota bacterium]
MQLFEEIKTLLGESTTYYLIAVDMDSNYSYLNRRYAQIFAPIHGDLVNKHYAITMHPDDQHTCKIVSQMAFSYPESSFPATLRKHDGKGGYIVTRWEYKAMFDDSGLPNGIFCIGHDITELIQVSNELDNLKSSHSHQVRKHVANMMALGKLIGQAESLNDAQDAARMIEESATELDAVIRELYT